MKLVQVREVMVPISDYATVSQDATLREAINALEEAQERFHRKRYPHRAVLVLDENDYVIGKLSQPDVLRALEHPYREVTKSESTHRFGFSYKFIKSVADNYHDFEQPMANLFTRAGRVRVKDAMYVPTQGEFIREDASLDEAIYLLAKGRHQSLLVVNDEGVSGILRLSDVFSIISKQIKTESD